MTHAGSESFQSAVKKSWFETADQPRAVEYGCRPVGLSETSAEGVLLHSTNLGRGRVFDLILLE